MFSVESADMDLSTTLPQLHYPISDRCSFPSSCQQPINPSSSSGPPAWLDFFFFFFFRNTKTHHISCLSTGITRCWPVSFLIHLSRKPSKVRLFWAWVPRFSGAPQCIPDRDFLPKPSTLPWSIHTISAFSQTADNCLSLYRRELLGSGARSAPESPVTRCVDTTMSS